MDYFRKIAETPLYMTPFFRASCQTDLMRTKSGFKPVILTLQSADRLCSSGNASLRVSSDCILPHQSTQPRVSHDDPARDDRRISLLLQVLHISPTHAHNSLDNNVPFYASLRDCCSMSLAFFLPESRRPWIILLMMAIIQSPTKMPSTAMAPMATRLAESATISGSVTGDLDSRVVSFCYLSPAL